MTARPLCIDLFCGLGGWAQGFLIAGYEVIGFDIERHNYGAGGYPGQLALQDVLTLHGAQFKDAACIVASPPCQEFSYMAMPWKRGKQIARALRGQDGFPAGYRGSRTIAELTALFDACFRIQREASEAAGRHIPMVVENVKGAEPWVGRANARYGSYYLWGDVAMVGGRIVRPDAGFGAESVRARCGQKCNPDGTQHGQDQRYGSVAALNDPGAGVKQHGSGRDWFDQGIAALPSGSKGSGGSWFVHPCATRPSERGHWKNGGDITRAFNSSGPARKAASALIAKIPFPLAHHVAQMVGFAGGPS